MKIKVKDKVLVTTGKYKGKVGTVMRVYKKTRRITIEKINIRTRHIKKTATAAGQRVQYEAPMDASNVMLVCPSCKKAVRVGYSQPDSAKGGSASGRKGKKYRVCKKCAESVEQAVASVAAKKSAKK